MSSTFRPGKHFTPDEKSKIHELFHAYLEDHDLTVSDYFDLPKRSKGAASEISAQLPGRSRIVISDYIRSHFHPEYAGKGHHHYTAEDDRLILEAAKTRNWKKVRDAISVFPRHIRDRARELRRETTGVWSEAELDKLRAIITGLYPNQPVPLQGLPWGTIARAMKTRSSIQCRLRWGRLTAEPSSWEAAHDREFVQWLSNQGYCDEAEVDFCAASDALRRTPNDLRTRLRTLIRRVPDAARMEFFSLVETLVAEYVTAFDMMVSDVTTESRKAEEE